MKVKAIQFVPLGRPPKRGECYRWSKSESFHIAHDSDIRDIKHDDLSAIGNPDAEAVERREVEVDVPDPVPGWIECAFTDVDLHITPGASEAYKRQAKKEVAEQFRAHVEERAKAAAERWDSPSGSSRAHDGETHRGWMERMIREEFLRP